MPARVRRPQKGVRRERDADDDATATAPQQQAQRPAAGERAERIRRREAAATEEAAREWEDASSESELDSDVDEKFDQIDDGEVVRSDEDEDYAEFAAEAAGDKDKKVSFADEDGAGAEDEDGEGEGGGVGRVWRRDQDGLQVGVDLNYTNRCYDSFFQLRSEFPCLSFDVVRDGLGAGRTKYPMEATFVCGSQASAAGDNQLYIMKISNLLRTKHDVEDEDASDEDMFGADDSESDRDADAEEVNDGEPLISYQVVKHHGTINRLRCNPRRSQLVAAWSEEGFVQVFDIEEELRKVGDWAAWAKEQQGKIPSKEQARGKSALKFSSAGVLSGGAAVHTTEGYGLAWSTVADHTFATGDCNGSIGIWQPAESRWAPAAVARPAFPSQQSVEELQWSPTQPAVLFAARAGGITEIWDTRATSSGAKISWRADPTDINVASWNPSPQASHLIATGADSGAVSVWDLRKVGRGAGAGQAPPSLDPLQQLTFHNGNAITAVEFSEHNESVLAATSADGQCTLWDLSLERDANEEKDVMGELFDRRDTQGLPDQLMFQHQGLVHPKEVHMHAQIPGLVVTTDFQGLHIFKPRNWRSLMK